MAIHSLSLISLSPPHVAIANEETQFTPTGVAKQGEGWT